MFGILAQSNSFGQGYNHHWLLGSWLFYQDPKGRILFDSSSYTLINEQRKMVFWGTEGNISDANGNFLMSSNGIWIANSTNDTMMNGSGLNPGSFVNSWPYAMPLIANNIFLTYPNDTTKYILFHQTNTTNDVPSNELYYSVIDIGLDGGLGGIILKNILVYSDSLSYGLSACKHANGRDWWVVAMRDSSDIIKVTLLTDSGVNNTGTQALNFLPYPGGNAMQPTFSQDGTKFITNTYDDPVNRNSSIVIADFDRCSGIFSNTQTLQLVSGDYLWGLAFSPSGQYAYACSNAYVFQVDVNTLSVDTVAIYDGFISPPTSGCCPSTFFNMYLAANGKIYITSGSTAQHLHVINYPDSVGLACDVQQHAINLGYGQLGAVPNHPNYYLGCDTTLGCACLVNVGTNEIGVHDFNYRLSPNPVTSNYLHIGYQLPQNQPGTFQVMDITGKIVFTYHLPQWSNEQSLSLPQLCEGLYIGVITSGTYRANKKFAVISSHK